MSEPRPCERQCKQCGEWKHHSRFKRCRKKQRVAGQRSRGLARDGTVAGQWEFAPICKSCEQINRNTKKNTDRPLAIIQGRASAAAQKTGVPGINREFFMTQMNYIALVEEMRAMMTPRGLCKACGHHFQNERDIQIEHIRPPRHLQDWARLSARNIRLLCTSCNVGKGSMDFDEWLDQQEDQRLSNLESPSPASVSTKNPQLTLF